jgi:hypothetical protein
MTTINNMLMKFPTGIFAGKEPRITNEYVSVYDIIKVAGNQKNPRMVWERLKETYGEEVVSFCDNLKFPGAGQRETPCINAKGLVKLLMWIPGKLAQEFRSQTADIMIRYLGGDTSLVNEIKYTNELHIQDGESNIFRKAIKKKLSYDDKYYMYIRVFSPFFEAEQKNIKVDEKVRRLSWDIIKFGIAKYLDNRENSYSNDSGYFQFSIEVPSKECAIFIEKISRQEFKDITIGNSFEYLDSKKLGKQFGIIKDINAELEKRDYYKSAKELYTKMVTDLHMYYPDEKDNFGTMYHPRCEEDENFNTIISNSVIQLTKEKLPNYVLKECQIIDKKKIEVEIKELEKQSDIQELNMDQENLLKELEELKLTQLNLIKLVKEKAPEVLKEFTDNEIKAMEHKKKYKKIQVYQYSLDGKFLRYFNSVTEAANKYECSTKIIRISCQNEKAFSGFLWRSSSQVQSQDDLLSRKVEQCDIADYKVIRVFDSFEEIVLDANIKNIKMFYINEVYRSIDLGLIYNNYRWKFMDSELKFSKLIGRTGNKKRVAKLNDNKEVICMFNSLMEASENMKYKSKSVLSLAIKNNKLVGGFYWEYIK